MSIELDEVYVASIKEMFKEFDDEIIWTAIFEYGYNSDNTYNLENVVNYLLELSSDTINEKKNVENIEKNKYVKKEKKNNNEEEDIYNGKFIIPSSNINENTRLLDLEEDYEEAEELTPSVYQNIVDFISNNNNGYQKIEDD